MSLSISTNSVICIMLQTLSILLFCKHMHIVAWKLLFLSGVVDTFVSVAWSCPFICNCQLHMFPVKRSRYLEVCMGICMPVTDYWLETQNANWLLIWEQKINWLLITDYYNLTDELIWPMNYWFFVEIYWNFVRNGKFLFSVGFRQFYPLFSSLTDLEKN